MEHTSNQGNRLNYQRMLDQTLERIRQEGRRPQLLLHSCCGPCSSYVLQYLAADFDIVLFYSNSNIAPEEEYRHRLSEQRRLIREMPLAGRVEVVEDVYDPDAFSAAAAGLEEQPEGGARCARCFALRLERSAAAAARLGMDWFTTTLTVSPHKNPSVINPIGQAMGERYGVPFLCADFKKRDGYQQSIRLSRQYGLYRQGYCGCIYSLSPPDGMHRPAGGPVSQPGQESGPAR